MPTTVSLNSPPGGASFITASVSDCIVQTGYEKRNLSARQSFGSSPSLDQDRPIELTKSVLGRVDRLDSRLRSYATVMEEQALAAAERAAAKIASGSYRGPLHGIPVAVKDLCWPITYRSSMPPRSRG